MLPALGIEMLPPHLPPPAPQHAGTLPLHALAQPLPARPCLEGWRAAAAPSICLHKAGRLTFPAPLVRAVVESRPSRFIMRVRVDGATVDAYCPATTRIGGLAAAALLGAEMPCLLSVPASTARRRTLFTVEAVSLDAPGAPSPSWIGINQKAANRYVEHFLSSGALGMVCRMPGRLQREQQLGMSRIDFLYEGRDAVEVKTPLNAFPLDRIGNPHLLHALATSRPHYLEADDYRRFMRHLDAMQATLAAQRRALGLRARRLRTARRVPGEPRAAVLHCHLMDAPAPSLARAAADTPVRAAVRERIMRAVRAGVELWQVNMVVDPCGVTLHRYFPIYS